MADQASSSDAQPENTPQNTEKQAEEFKNIGNEHYKKQQYSEAIENYTKAIGSY